MLEQRQMAVDLVEMHRIGQVGPRSPSHSPGTKNPPVWRAPKRAVTALAAVRAP
jgi:hypothetical protein